MKNLYNIEVKVDTEWAPIYYFAANDYLDAMALLVNVNNGTTLNNIRARFPKNELRIARG